MFEAKYFHFEIFSGGGEGDIYPDNSRHNRFIHGILLLPVPIERLPQSVRQRTPKLEVVRGQ